MDMNDSYYINYVMEVIDEAEKDLSYDEFYILIEDIIQALEEKKYT